MSVSGLCQICEAKEAVDRCDQCGSLVCLAHYDESLGFCANCAAAVTRDGGEGGAGDRGADEREYRF